MKLHEIQRQLRAPKNQFNSFGKYSYRNCEDILEAVKPFLGENVLTLSDEIHQFHDRFYVRAEATFMEKDGQNVRSYSAAAFARETEDKKGMDAAQITGSASSYARKYALNGLFLIDDAKDPDNPAAAGVGSVDGADVAETTTRYTKPKIATKPIIVPKELPKVDGPPRKLEYETGIGPGSDYTSFGQRFVAAISTAATVDEISLWERENKDIIFEIHENAPRIAAALKDRIREHYGRVREKENEHEESHG